MAIRVLSTPPDPTFVRKTWRSVVAPNQLLFISLLVAFEAAVGILLLIGGRWAQIGMVAAMAFHVALLSFGWWYCLWSIPMVVALLLLLRAHRRWSAQRGERSRLASTAELRPPRVA